MLSCRSPEPLIRPGPGPGTRPNAVVTASLRRLEPSRIICPNAVVTARLRRSEPGPITRPHAVATLRPRRLEPGPITRPNAVATARLRRRDYGGGKVAFNWHIGGRRCAPEQPRQHRAAIPKNPKRQERPENAVPKSGSREYTRFWGWVGVSVHGDDPR